MRTRSGSAAFRGPVRVTLCAQLKLRDLGPPSPESSLVLKFRADPSKRHEAHEQKRHARLMEALAARTDTAVPLQPTIAKAGS